ncbi:hypothetical protein REPUB_Repub03eG0203200 [Reevesia pubescens]
MDILQGQTQVQNREKLEILRYAGCLKASSIPTYSTFDKFLISKISFSEKSNIVFSRMRKNISDSTRDALLVVLVLILTATYQSAVNPPYDIGEAYLRQNNIFQSGNGAPNTLPGNENGGSIPLPFDPTNNQLDNGGSIPLPFDPNNNQPDNSGNDLNELVEVKVDPLDLSFSIFNAVDFVVTLLVTLCILPWVPYVITLIVGIFIVMNKVRSRIGYTVDQNKRKVYRECIKEFGDGYAFASATTINKK